MMTSRSDYGAWLARMPTNDSYPEWRQEGVRRGCVNGEPPEPAPLFDDLGDPDDDRMPMDTPAPRPWPEPEDRGTAVLSQLGEVEYVEDLIRPGRIVVWAAEEGSGKSYSVDDELAIRVAVASGSFAGTWPVLETGPVLVLSEMHSDDDYTREAETLASLGLERTALTGRYYRLPLMTAAHGAPALTVPAWREWVTTWLRDRGALLMIIDTATGATQVDPWGREIQAVYRDLRLMLDEYPALAIVLIVHVKKPTGRGERRLSDVIGEWGRWNDVTVMQENEGASLQRAKITVRKRVRHERRIVATKSGGLLVDPVDTTERVAGPKVPTDKVLAAIVEGMTFADLAAAIGVSKPTAVKYVAGLDDGLVTVVKGGRGRPERLYRTAKVQNTAKQAGFGGDLAVPVAVPGDQVQTAKPPIYG